MDGKEWLARSKIDAIIKMTQLFLYALKVKPRASNFNSVSGPLNGSKYRWSWFSGLHYKENI